MAWEQWLSFLEGPYFSAVATNVTDYGEWRHQFMFRRLHLGISVAMLLFLSFIPVDLVLHLNEPSVLTVWNLLGRVAIEVLLLLCLSVLQTAWGKHHLRLMFLLFSLIVSSIEPIVQVMGQAAPLDLLHWNLVFFFQATLIPVLWPLHLLSQLLAIAIYGLLHISLNLPLPAASWGESLSSSSIRLVWICLLPTISVLLYERLARSEFRSRLLMQAQQAQLTASNQVLTELSQVDPLTKLHNRRYFDQVLQQEWQRHCREHQSLAVLLMDVDFFKRYNDTYGHPAGDRCLQTVAESICKGVKRAADVVARYGGEEFIVLLPNTNLEGATLVADRIRFHLRLINLPHQASEVSDAVTLSIGVAACIPTTETQASELVTLADVALYRAKETGRNRVVAANP